MSKSHVSMEQKQCFICYNVYDTNSILLDRRLRQSMESKTVTGFGTCPECQGRLDKDYIALIGATPKSQHASTAKNDEVDRTGDLVWIRKRVFSNVFNAPVPPQGIAFVEPAVIELMKAKMESADGPATPEETS